MTSKLLERAEDHVKEYLRPDEASRLVRRVRKVHFFIRVTAELVTSVDEEAGAYTYFHSYTNLRVSQAQAIKYLEEAGETATRLSEREKDPVENGRVAVSRYGDCIFLG